VLDLIRANAKAIAVPITALIVWGCAQLAENAGITVAVDNDKVTGAVATLIVAVSVWATRNAPKP